MAMNNIKNHLSEKHIAFMIKRGIINKYDDELFHNNKPVTNAQFTILILKSAISEIPSGNNRSYDDYLEYAIQKRIITDLESEFPNSPVTRQSAARIVHESLLKLFGETDNDNWQDAESLPDLYSCHSCVMHIAQVYVKGIITPYDDGAFHLTDYLTFSETADIIIRIIDPSLRIVPPSLGHDIEFIDYAAALEMIKGGAVLIDVRNSDDYAAGHLIDAVSVPISELIYDSKTAMRNISADSSIIVYCRTGANSTKAASLLKKSGFIKVHNLGGIENKGYEIIY